MVCHFSISLQVGAGQGQVGEKRCVVHPSHYVPAHGHRGIRGRIRHRQHQISCGALGGLRVCACMSKLPLHGKWCEVEDGKGLCFHQGWCNLAGRSQFMLIPLNDNSLIGVAKCLLLLTPVLLFLPLSAACHSCPLAIWPECTSTWVSASWALLASRCGARERQGELYGAWHHSSVDCSLNAPVYTCVYACVCAGLSADDNNHIHSHVHTCEHHGKMMSGFLYKGTNADFAR